MDTLTGSLIKVKALDPCVMEFTEDETLIVGKIYDAEWQKDNGTIAVIDEDGDRHTFDHPDCIPKGETAFFGHP